MRAKLLPVLAVCVLAGATTTGQMQRTSGGPERGGVKRITWADTVPVRGLLESRGFTAASFTSHVDRLRETHLARVRQGDLDHLIFYLLQSTAFTSLAPIEPALSAKALVEPLGTSERDAFLRGDTAGVHVPPAVRARTTALLKAVERPARDTRLGGLWRAREDRLY